MADYRFQRYGFCVNLFFQFENKLTRNSAFPLVWICDFPSSAIELSLSYRNELRLIFWPSVTIFIFVIYCLKISWSPRDCSRFPFYCFEMGQKYNIHFTIIFLIDNTRYSFFITAETIFYIDEDIARFARRLKEQKYQLAAASYH